MDKKSKELFTESIKQAILQHVGLFESQCDLLDGFESIIYKVQFEGEPCALRISHSLHRSPIQVRGELEWIQHLVDHGLSIPTAKRLPCGDTLISLSDGVGGAFTAVCFTWAQGVHVWEQEEVPWGSALFEKMGEMTGTMHHLAKDFRFKHSCSERPHWHEEPGQNIRQYLPVHDEVIAKIYDRLNHQIKQIDQNRHDYGLIHYDFHRGNFFVNKKGITLFDFDDCQYHLFVADIAIAVFYAIPFDRTKVLQQSAAQLFFQSFMRGYLRKNEVDTKWLAWIPALLKQREIDLFTVMHRSFDVSDQDSMDKWSQNFLQNRRERILNEVPVIDLNWKALFDEVAAETAELA